MNEDPEKKSADTDKEIEREIRANRKFSLNDAIGQIVHSMESLS